jgi:hypothetical protein
MATPAPTRTRVTEWEHRLLFWVSGLLLFETLTGLSIFLLPFSLSNQAMVLIHAAAGVLFLVPLVWYQVRHWGKYRSLRMTHVKLTGYFSMATVSVTALSGVVLTVEALARARISAGWDLIHTIGTFALIASVLPHVLSLVYYNLKSLKKESALVRVAERRFAARTSLVCAGLFGVVALVVLAYPRVELQNQLPADYTFLFGPDRPFAPSLARTMTGQAFDARSMGGSASCGTSGCHRQIYDEWAVSAHRYAAMDLGFRAIQKTMGEQNGPESTRYCGGCHDPISLFAGTKNLYQDDLTNPIGHDEGVSCIVCHSIKETDVKGNASYVIAQPGRYMFELHPDSGGTRLVRDFLIKAYPRYHVQSLQHRLFKSPEFCAACHKQFIDEEINQVGWVQLQNQYDNWRNSRWNDSTDARKSIECRECHMPLAASDDPARGDQLDYNRSGRDGKHRSHRFLAANQFMPLVLKLPGAEKHAELTEKWLQGRIDIDEIADKWRTGPAVPIELLAPATARPGDEIAVRVVITNNKVGHDFPTGPLDIIQSWVELVAKDQDGHVVHQTGRRDETSFIEPGSFIFKAEPVDQYGKLIDRHNLWEMVGVRYRRALFPGQSDLAQFTFECPAGDIVPAGRAPRSLTEENFQIRTPRRVTRLDLSAKLMYRKVDQFLLNFLFGESSGITSPVTVLSEDQKSIQVVR